MRRRGLPARTARAAAIATAATATAATRTTAAIPAGATATLLTRSGHPLARALPLFAFRQGEKLTYCSMRLVYCDISIGCAAGIRVGNGNPAEAGTPNHVGLLIGRYSGSHGGLNSGA